MIYKANKKKGMTNIKKERNKTYNIFYTRNNNRDLSILKGTFTFSSLKDFPQHI